MIRRNRQTWGREEDAQKVDEIEIPEYEVEDDSFDMEWDEWTVRWIDDRTCSRKSEVWNVGEANTALRGMTDRERQITQVTINGRPWDGGLCCPRDRVRLQVKANDSKDDLKEQRDDESERRNVPQIDSEISGSRRLDEVIWLTVPDGKFNLEAQECDRKFRTYRSALQAGEREATMAIRTICDNMTPENRPGS
jgi:hypothetical protein